MVMADQRDSELHMAEAAMAAAEHGHVHQHVGGSAVI